MAFRGSLVRAFRRTGLQAERNDIHPALKKLWKKHYEVDGQVTQMLSPFEQNIVSGMFHDAGSKIFKKVADFALEAGPGLLVGIAVYYWAEWKHKDLAYHHRS